MSDRALLYASAALRSVSIGMVGVLLGTFLAILHLRPAEIGLVVGAGLAGGAFGNLLATLAADRVGRRRFLVALAALGAVGSAVVAIASDAFVLGVAAFVGMVNGMGRDRGAALALEQAALPATTTDALRTRAFAWYNLLQDIGHAAGALLAGLPALFHHFGAEQSASFRLAMGAHAALALALLPIYLALSPGVEAPKDPAAPRRLSPGSRRVLWRINSLFALDSLGGGFLTTALLSYFFYERFGVSAARIGGLFFAARVANALSHLLAAWLARRIGLVNTMVFTHMPSSLLLVGVALAPSFPLAAALFLLREVLVEMDVPTRQSYVMAVVRPEERTAASGVTNLVRLGGWTVGPAFAGVFMQGVSLMTPLVLGAGLKIVYDALLYVAFRRAKPPEELPAAAEPITRRPVA